MIYPIEGSTKIKAHHAHFATTVQCLLNKIGNGQKGITSTKTFAETKLWIWEEVSPLSKVI